MLIIPIVGPSHAGKSTLIRIVSTNPERFALPPTVVNLNRGRRRSSGPIPISSENPSRGISSSSTSGLKTMISHA